MPKTLLLADDSVTIQKVVGISFANEDIALLTVDNGDDAIARVREARPDIVLADVVMPGMNGYEVCEAIKSDPQLRETPVLLLTGTFEAFDEERASRAGADGHITKPFEAQSLVDQVNARLSQATAPSPMPEPTSPEASPAAPQQTLEQEEPPAQQETPEASPEGGESFDFFDEEITEPRGAPSETMVVSDDLGVDAEPEDAFAFEASDDLQGESSPPSLSDSEPEFAAPGEMLAPSPEPEMAPDSTVAILPEDEAFGSALAEPTSAPATLGEEDLTELEPEEPPAVPAASPLEDLSSDLPEEPVPTRVIHEAVAPDASPEPASESLSGSPDETLILSDLDTDPLGGPPPTDTMETAEAPPAEGPADDPLAQVEPDDLAVEAVLDPSGGRDWDISSSDLGDPLQEAAAAPEPAQPESPSPWPTELPSTEEGEAQAESPSPWPTEPPSMEEGELLTEPAPEEAPEPEPEFEPEPVMAPPEDLSTPSPAGAVDLSPVTREQLHEALERIAWDAFGDLSEQIVKEALERIEKVAWEVIPQMAEALIQEEIRKLKGEDD
jgi:CheY-like chemotaxis protein